MSHLACLPEGLTPESVAAPAHLGVVRPSDLSARVRTGLKHGWRQADYRGPDQLDFAIALACQHRGYTFAALHAGYAMGALSTPSADREFRRGGEVGRTAHLLSKWEAAGRKRAPEDGFSAMLSMVEMLDRLVWLPLPWRGGSTDRAVLWTIARAGVRDETVTPRVGRVELAMVTGRSEDAIEGSLKRLVRRRLVHKVDSGDTGRRTTWRVSLHVDVRDQGEPCRDYYGGTANPGLAPTPNEDLWHAGSYGLLAWEVMHLSHHAGRLSITAIVRLTGRNPSTVRRVLRSLADVGLMDHAEDEWWTAPGADLSRAATQVKVTGAHAQHIGRIADRAAHRKGFRLQREAAVADLIAYKAFLDSRRSVLTPNGRGGWCTTVVDAHSPTFPEWRRLRVA